MKMTVVAISKADIQGVSKKGAPYKIDETRLTVALPFDTDDGFGIKTHEYVFGKAADFNKYQDLRGKLPVEADITLATELNTYGQPVTVVSDLKILSVKAPQS